jgi:ferric-dicitrate binding protein FerR (iron transport regulator)
MHELIVRFFQRKTTAAEDQALAEWRAASPDNEREFQEIEHVWRMTADLAPDAEAAPPTADDIIRRARDLPEPREPNVKPRRTLPARHRIERDANGHYRLFLLDDDEEERLRKESGGGA